MESQPIKDTCPFCDQLIDKNLMNDHIMCHQIQNEEEFNNQNNKTPHENANDNFSQNGNHYSNSNNTPNNNNINNISNNNNINNTSNNNNINNKSNNDNSKIDTKYLTLLKYLIAINKLDNKGQLQLDNLKNAFSHINNEKNIPIEKDAINTMFEGFSVVGQQFKGLCNQFNDIFGGGNNKNNISSSNDTNGNPESTNKSPFDDNNNTQNGNTNNKYINEDEVNLIMECLSSDILNEKKEGNNNKCHICFQQFGIGQTITTLPCSHIFHFNCIKSRIKNDTNCPICQFNISLDNIIK